MGNSFALLFGSLLGFLLIYPYVLHLPGSGLLLEGAMTLVLVAALHSLANHPREWVGGALLLVPAATISWVSLFWFNSTLQLVATSCTGLFLCYTIFFLSRTLFFTSEICTNVLWAALCIYMLIGMACAQIYLLAELIDPQAFLGLAVEVIDRSDIREMYQALLYYSLVTLTTLGYGDIVPGLASVRSIAVTEAIIGQLYIAIVVARLLGTHLHQVQTRDNSQEEEEQ